MMLARVRTQVFTTPSDGALDFGPSLNQLKKHLKIIENGYLVPPNLKVSHSAF